MLSSLESPIGIILKSVRKKIVSRPTKSLPKEALNQIEFVLTSKNRLVYQYDIVGIYDHLSIYRDDSAFQKLDRLLFPGFGSRIITNVSFQLACTRLYCLCKYQLPDRESVELVRELMHDCSPTLSDLNLLVQLFEFESLKLDEQVTKMLEEMLDYAAQEIEHTDIFTLITFYKRLCQDRLNLAKTQGVRKTIENIISLNSSALPSYHIKSVSNSK